MDTYQDYKLHAKLRRKLHESKYDYLLRTLSNCGAICDTSNGVHVLANGKHVKILGNRFCSNSWGCPACTARKMAKYSQKVSAAIDALSQQGKVAIMITFTVFHSKEHSLNQVLNLLGETWRTLKRNERWKRKKKNSDEYYTKAGAYQQFLQKFNIQHVIKATEITYGKHGWHPHLHVLHFINESDLPYVAQWQDALIEQWQKYEQKAAEKIFSSEMFRVRKFLQEKSEAMSDHHGVYISKNSDGRATQIKSGDYICGWGGNNELTGGSQNLKEANPGHMTLIQMVLQSLETDDEKLFAIYCEAMVTLLRRRQHKIEFSRTGLKAIITTYTNTENYKEYLKKKRMDYISQKNIAPYHTVAWFSRELWYNISIIEHTKKISLIPRIVALANQPQAFKKICQLLKHFNLPPPLEKCPGIDIAESFNQLCGITA